MDISFGEKGDAFRARYRKFLEQNLPDGWNSEEWVEPLNDKDLAKFWLEFEQKIIDAGFACPDWPAEYGGGGLTFLEKTIWVEENARAGLPDQINIMGLSMIGPTLLHYGEEWQKKRFIPKIISNEEIWCQGYSEPGAGSDLASLKTKAELVGDEWVINGQKIWATQGHNANWCFLLARTNPDAPRHHDLSCLLVPLNQPGVQQNALEQITGKSEYAEIFFDNAKCPANHVVGAVGDGWKVGQALLGWERGGYALGKGMMIKRLLSRLKTYARQHPRGIYKRAIDDPVIAYKFVEYETELEGLRLTLYRNVSQYFQGVQPGIEGSVAKIIWTELWQKVSELALDIMGPLSDKYLGSLDAPFGGEFSYNYLESRGWSIASGANEIQRNLIAWYLLELPRK